MERREVIKLVTLATGSVLSLPLLNSLLVSCQDVPVKDEGAYTQHFFNNDDFDFVKEIVDVILPKTDSPSATEVGVHQIIDTMVGTVYSESTKKDYQTKFNSLKNAIKSSDKSLQEFLENLIKTEEVSEQKKALTDIRQQVIAYYLSTEEISKNHLNYLPVPGKYEPCISLDEVGGKAWAL